MSYSSVILAVAFLFLRMPEDQAGVNILPMPETKRITILAGSKIYLEGTTNVSSFRCHCEDYFEPIQIELESEPAHFVFRKAHLRMTTRKLNCQNEKINRDMYLALKSEAYPFIRVELLDNWFDQNETRKLNTWFNVKARIKLTITNVTKEIYIQGTAKRLTADTYELKGSKFILMSAFGIDPPQAMFGMIRVNDSIGLHFYLKVRAE